MHRALYVRAQLAALAEMGAFAAGGAAAAVEGGFADPAGGDVAEEEAHYGEGAGDDDQVRLDETGTM